MEFNKQYYTPMDRGYSGNVMPDINPQAGIEQPIIPISQIGQTATEGGRFGTLIQTATAAIRAGAGKIELQTQMGGGAEPAGAESYGKEAREALRELAKASEVTFTSVHTPTDVGNLSGFNPRQGNFSDEYRRTEIDEVKKAIRFAAEATQGGAVVVHTGEFHRPIFDSDWNKKGKWAGAFVAYDEEPEKAVMHLVDKRTGKILSEIRRNQVVYRPVWNTYKGKEQMKLEDGTVVNPGDYIDYEGRKVERLQDRVPEYDSSKGQFKVEPMTWNDFQNEADERNMFFEKEYGRKPQGDEVLTPEEAFMHAQFEGHIGTANAWAITYGKSVKDNLEGLKKLNDSLKYYEKVEKGANEEELLSLKKDVASKLGLGGFVPEEKKLPSEIIKERLWDIKREIESAKDMATSQLQQAGEQEIFKNNSVSISKYAKKKSMEGFAEAGISAMQETQHNKFARRDVYVAPENIFPEMGYGSHPDEMIELVKGARKEMVRMLTSKEIEKLDEKGNAVKAPNPHYAGMDDKEAEELAKRHIKSTLDTQHLGMWWSHFKPNSGETEDERRKRFDKWYLEQVEKLVKEDVIGNVHLVDSIGGGHQHLPAGQGDLPVVEAVKRMVKLGYKGPINSEAYGEERFGQGRILVETWSAFGSTIGKGYFGGQLGLPQMWSDVRESYFGNTYPPKFVFGAYAPSNDWTLWSQTPLE